MLLRQSKKRPERDGLDIQKEEIVDILVQGSDHGC